MLFFRILVSASLYLTMAHAFEGCHQGHVHPQREVSETSTELDPFTITVTPDMTATYLASASSSSSPLITHVPTVGELGTFLFFFPFFPLSSTPLFSLVLLSTNISQDLTSHPQLRSTAPRARFHNPEIEGSRAAPEEGYYRTVFNRGGGLCCV